MAGLVTAGKNLLLDSGIGAFAYMSLHSAATGATATTCTVQHGTGRRSVLLSRTILRSTTRGVVGVRSPEYLAQHAQRARDDDELTLMLL